MSRRHRKSEYCTGYTPARLPSVPHIKGVLTAGYDEARIEKFDGPLDDTMRKLIKKYGIPKESLYFVAIPVIFGWYGIAAVMTGVRLAYGI